MTKPNCKMFPASLKRRSTSATLILSSLFAATVSAQSEGELKSSDTESKGRQLEEILVTAQRRTQNLSDVPIAVTALTGEEARRNRARSLTDLASFVPNLQVNSVIGESTPIFSLRGVSMSDYSLNQQGPIATYIDEVYRGSSTIFGVSMFDLDRVEVLRGPQGTLYGKNTTGGAVKIFTEKPDLENVSGYIDVGLGNFDRREASGAFNVPLSDSVAVRLAGVVTRSDGWFENQLPGQPDLNEVREYGVRASLLWEPRQDASVVLRLSSSQQDPYNYGIFAEAGEFGVGAGLYAFYNDLYPEQNPNTDYFRTGLDDYELESDYTVRRDNTVDEVSLSIDFPLSETLSLTSITSWTDGELLIPEESDGSPLRVLELPQYGETTQFTQDLRVTSDDTSNFNYIIGAFYSREESDINNIFRGFADIDANGDGQINGNDCIDSGFFICEYENSFEQIKTSYAIYADGTFELTDKVSLSAGLRYTDDEGEQNDYKSVVSGIDGTPLFNLIPGSEDLDATVDQEFSTDDVSGRFVVDVQLDSGAMIYGSVNRGYRGGAFNAQAYVALDELTQADPETLMAYEVGIKQSVLDGSLQYTAAAFYYDYQDQQFLDIDASALQRVANIDESTIIGAELEVAWLPLHDLSFNFSLSLLDSEIQKGELRGIDLEGNELPNAPRYSATASMDWTFMRFSEAELLMNLNGRYVDSQYFDVYEVDRLEQSSYGLLNGRLSYIDVNAGLEAHLWVKNIFEEFYYTNRIDVQSYGFDYNHIGAPRTYGISFKKSF